MTATPSKISPDLSRRSVLKFMSAGAAGLGLGLFNLPVGATDKNIKFAPNAFLEVHADNSVHLWCKRTEMGQLIKTGVATILADELGADLDTMQVHMTTAEEKFGYVGTGGSGATMGAWRYYRPLFAAAREMLVSAAAQRWGAEPEVCFTDASHVIHRGSGRKLPFGTLVEAAANLPVPEEPELKKSSDFKYIGQSRPRRDIANVLSGGAQYGADVSFPGMKYVSIERCPVRGGTLVSVDSAAAQAFAGVERVLQLSNAVAIIAENSWAAMRARELLRVTWDLGANQHVDSQQLDAQLDEGLADPGYLIRETGEPLSSARTLSWVYEIPAASHAPLETATATAWFRDGKLEIWSPCHQQTLAMRETAKRFELEEKDIVIHTTLAGGSFGRKLVRDFVIEAAEVALKVPYPVQLLYTREDDNAHGPNRPPTKHKVSFELDNAGKPVSCGFHMAGYSVAEQEGPGGISDKGFDWTAALGANDIPYSFDHIRISHKMFVTDALFFTWWRGTYRNHNCFALECAVDELAIETGRDPLALRLDLLPRDVIAETYPGDMETVSSARMKNMLAMLGEKSAYNAPRPAGRAVGIACHCYTDVNGYSAFAVDASVADEEVTVHKVTVVIDCGQVINPSAVKAQVEGSVAFGLSGAMLQETTLEQGRVQQLNFDSSPVLRMVECPEIEVHLMPSEAEPGGVGEPALTPLMPAFMNAVSRAVGKRIRRLPLGDQLAGDRT